MAEENKKILEGQKFLCALEVKAIDEENFTADVVISSGNRDRMGDILEPEVIIAGSKNFMRNPVLINSHDSWGGVEKILGKFLELSVSGKKTIGKVKYFVGQGNPAADWAFNLAKQGIAAFSIGFRGLAYEYIEEKDADGYKRVTGYNFTKIELLEVSQVAIPANPDALMKAFTTFSQTSGARAPQPESKEKKAVNKFEGKELAEKFSKFLK